MLREVGFVERTERVAWRHTSAGTDVLTVHTAGGDAAACGCTRVSFGAIIACAPSFLTLERSPIGRDGLPHPHYWDCGLKITLEKTLAQPWFTPFADGIHAATPSMRAHLAGLAAVVRRDRHDRPDIWFVREDGSNLSETVADLRAVVAAVGLPMLDRFHDPCDVMELVRAGTTSVSIDAQYDLDEVAQGC
jgi:hypothetical protein